MPPKSDAQLLREYAERGSETAFSEIVARHASLVYSAALRLVESPDIAIEVAQNVFLGLARVARPLSVRLTENSTLAGWVCRSARNISLNRRRDEFRRHTRERLAMQNLDPVSGDPSDWERLRPLLDEAMSELSETDYDAVVLRFFKNQDLRAVGLALGVSDDAAQKRVSRALDKLREILLRRGITTSAAALSAVLAAHAVQAAPIGLIGSIAATAALAGTAVPASTVIATTKTIAMTTLQKATIGATLVVAVGTGIYEARQTSILEYRVQALQQQHAGVILRLTDERNDAMSKLAALRDDNARLTANTPELLRLRDEVTRLRKDTRELAELKANPAQNSAENARDAIESAAEAWLAKVNQLKRLQEQMPDKRIPELQYLKERDWLDTVEDIDLTKDSEVRAALSKLRALGKRNFAKSMREALQKYTLANNQLLPTDLQQLKPFFHATVDDTTFERYQLLKTGNASALGPEEPVISEKVPVDDQYDTLFQIGIRGWQMRGTGEKNKSERGSVLLGPSIP